MVPECGEQKLGGEHNQNNQSKCVCVCLKQKAGKTGWRWTQSAISGQMGFREGKKSNTYTHCVKHNVWVAADPKQIELRNTCVR